MMMLVASNTFCNFDCETKKMKTKLITPQQTKIRNSFSLGYNNRTTMIFVHELCQHQTFIERIVLFLFLRH